MCTHSVRMGAHGGRCALWWNGREVVSISPTREGGYRLYLDALKMWQTKNAPVVSIRQSKCFAERWCAARLCPGLPLREAVIRLTDNTPIESRGASPWPTAYTGQAGKGSVRATSTEWGILRRERARCPGVDLCPTGLSKPFGSDGADYISLGRVQRRLVQIHGVGHRKPGELGRCGTLW